MEWPIWQNREVKTQEEAQFSVACMLSVAAHRINIGPDWQDLKTIRNPKIIEFMKKIRFALHPEWGKMVLEDQRSNPASVEVVAKGKTFKEERRYAKDTFGPEEVRMTDQELAEKFRGNASRIVPWQEIDRAIESIMALEKADNIAKTIRYVSA